MERSRGDQKMEGCRAEAVIDSSIVLKWFGKEEKSDQVLHLMDQHAEGSRPLWVRIT